MKLQKRIKQIVTLTVQDFFDSGKSSDESKEKLISWLTDTLMQEDLEDRCTYEISITVLSFLNSLDLVNLEFIHNILFANLERNEANITLSFKVVQNG